MGMRYLTAGESHGPQLTTILEGLPAGMPLLAEDINTELCKTAARIRPRKKNANRKRYSSNHIWGSSWINTWFSNCVSRGE